MEGRLDPDEEERESGDQAYTHVSFPLSSSREFDGFGCTLSSPGGYIACNWAMDTESMKIGYASFFYSS